MIHPLPHQKLANRMLRMEHLEGRYLLAADGIFARYEGSIVSAGQVGIEHANISAADFALTGGTVRVGFLVESTSGGFDPAAVTIRDDLGDAVMPVYATDDMADGIGSLVIADLGAESFQLDIAGEANSVGGYRMSVFLVGDANGDGQVNDQDGEVIRSAFGATSGDSLYSVSADANRDGAITSFDLAQWVRNRGELTSITANWGLSINTSPLSVVLSPGSLSTAFETVKVVGTTLPGLEVALDVDGDGLFDDGQMTTQANGEYGITTSLAMGLNTLVVRATDDFGQSRINSFEVTRVTSVPDKAQVFENFAIDRTGEVATGIGNQKVDNFAVDPGWEKVGTQNFGYRTTNNVGQGAGEIGGTFFRFSPTYYADEVDDLDSSTDPLMMSGNAIITANVGGGNFLLGWFDKDSDLSWPPPHFLGIRSDGPDIYLLGDQGGDKIATVTIGTAFSFQVNYDPIAGQLRGSINGGPEVIRNVSPSAINNLDRFGLVNLREAGSLANQTAYFDNLAYTFQVEDGPPVDASGWESFRNNSYPANPPLQVEDFGYSAGTNFAGGSAAGEIGGRVARGVTRAYYAKPIPAKTFDDVLSVSGTFAFDNDEGGTGSLIGWFNDELSTEWRTPSSIALRLDGNGSTYNVLFEYGTIDAYMDGIELTTLPANGAIHTFSMTYDPNVGFGRITVTVDGTLSKTLDLSAANRSRGAVFNRFGIWNQQFYGGGHDVYFDDLVIDGVVENFSVDPGWEELNNRISIPHAAVRPLHNFGYSPTSFALDDLNEAGELGGYAYRDENPAFYAANVGSLSLNDELHASGKIVFESGARADSGIYFGWFDSEARKEYVGFNSISNQPAFIGVLIEGPSRFGHGFRVGYANSNNEGQHYDAELSPRIQPDGVTHDWELHYNPNGAGGRGQIVMLFDGAARFLNLAPGQKAAGATFDRFGLFVMQIGGSHVRVFLDDVAFTADTSAVFGETASSAIESSVAELSLDSSYVESPTPIVASGVTRAGHDELFSRSGNRLDPRPSRRVNPEFYADQIELPRVRYELARLAPGTSSLGTTDVGHSTTIQAFELALEEVLKDELNYFDY